MSELDSLGVDYRVVRTESDGDAVARLAPRVESEAASAIELRTNAAWAFVSFAAAFGGVELDLDDPHDRNDLLRVVVALATGQCALKLRGRRRQLVEVRIGGQVMWRASSSPLTVLRPWVTTRSLAAWS